MSFSNALTKMLGIDFPLLMAPMFLVSNKAMMEEAMKAGIAGAFPSLNFRKEGELEELLTSLNATKQSLGKGTYGINLIVQQTNPLYKEHLQVCVKMKVPFYITSLGNPKEVIQKAHAYGAKVFCDITNIEHAEKCASLGCDGFIAVGQGAGGHAGPYPLQVLVPSLKKKFPDKIVIAAGGIAGGEGIVSALALGAEGVSVGTRFIASTEATVNNDYKKAIIDSGMEDIVMTEKISGTPCTIINNDFAKKIGYRQNWFERLLSRNPRTKKWFKTLVQLRGFNLLESSAFQGNYKTLWCAGQSVELVEEILPCAQIISGMKTATNAAFQRLKEGSGL